MTYDWAKDSRDSYTLAIEALREINIRKHVVLPETGRPDESRWWAEGERAIPALDTVRPPRPKKAFW